MFGKTKKRKAISVMPKRDITVSEMISNLLSYDGQTRVTAAFNGEDQIFRITGIQQDGQNIVVNLHANPVH